MHATNALHLIARCVVSLAVICTAVAAQAGPPEDTQQAETAIRTGDVFTAMATLRRLSDQGYAPAQARLADLLHSAEFDAEALALYRKAAEQGEAAGEFGLGRMYADAAGVPRDAALALQWYRKAAARNHAPALDALARAYRSGDLGLAKDLEEARTFDKRAQAARDAAGKDGR